MLGLLGFVDCAFFGCGRFLSTDWTSSEPAMQMPRQKAEWAHQACLGMAAHFGVAPREATPAAMAGAAQAEKPYRVARADGVAADYLPRAGASAAKEPEEKAGHCLPEQAEAVPVRVEAARAAAGATARPAAGSAVGSAAGSAAKNAEGQPAHEAAGESAAGAKAEKAAVAAVPVDVARDQGTDEATVRDAKPPMPKRHFRLMVDIACAPLHVVDAGGNQRSAYGAAYAPMVA